MNPDRPLQIQVLCGPLSGASETFAQSPVTFGRDAGNSIIVPEPFISRRHGRFEWQEDGWHLVNESPNPTSLGRKPVRRKPRRLLDRDVVYVGEHPVFEVRLPQIPANTSVDAPAEPPPAAEGAAEAGPAPARGKQRLWVGILVLWLACLSAVVLHSLLRSDADPAAPAPPLTRAEIAREIRRPITVEVRSDTLASQQLVEAQRFWQQRSALPDGLFQTHRAYQRALAYAGADALPNSTDQYRFEGVQAQLIDEVAQRYERAHTLMKNQQLTQALEDFGRLQAFYPDPKSAIFRNIEKQRQAIDAQLKALRQRRRR